MFKGYTEEEEREFRFFEYILQKHDANAGFVLRQSRMQSFSKVFQRTHTSGAFYDKMLQERLLGAFHVLMPHAYAYAKAESASVLHFYKLYKDGDTLRERKKATFEYLLSGADGKVTVYGDSSEVLVTLPGRQIGRRMPLEWDLNSDAPDTSEDRKYAVRIEVMEVIVPIPYKCRFKAAPPGFYETARNLLEEMTKRSMTKVIPGAGSKTVGDDSLSGSDEKYIEPDKHVVKGFEVNRYFGNTLSLYNVPVPKRNVRAAEIERKKEASKRPKEGKDVVMYFSSKEFTNVRASDGVQKNKFERIQPESAIVLETMKKAWERQTNGNYSLVEMTRYCRQLQALIVDDVKLGYTLQTSDDVTESIIRDLIRYFETRKPEERNRRKMMLMDETTRTPGFRKDIVGVIQSVNNKLILDGRLVKNTLFGLFQKALERMEGDENGYEWDDVCKQESVIIFMMYQKFGQYFDDVVKQSMFMCVGQPVWYQKEGKWSEKEGKWYAFRGFFQGAKGPLVMISDQEEKTVLAVNPQQCFSSNPVCDEGEQTHKWTRDSFYRHLYPYFTNEGAMNKDAMFYQLIRCLSCGDSVEEEMALEITNDVLEDETSIEWVIPNALYILLMWNYESTETTVPTETTQEAKNLASSVAKRILKWIENPKHRFRLKNIEEDNDASFDASVAYILCELMGNVVNGIFPSGMTDEEARTQMKDILESISSKT